MKKKYNISIYLKYLKITMLSIFSAGDTAAVYKS